MEIRLSKDSVTPSTYSKADMCKPRPAVRPGPSPGFSSRGAKNQKGVPHFKSTVLDVWSNQGAKREMGGTDFKWGGQAPLAPPLAKALSAARMVLFMILKWYFK